MTKYDLGLPSASKASTYQQNREMLRLENENQQLRNEVIRLKDKLLVRQKEMIDNERDLSAMFLKAV
jgi:cell division protein FtsB